MTYYLVFNCMNGKTTKHTNENEAREQADNLSAKNLVCAIIKVRVDTCHNIQELQATQY